MLFDLNFELDVTEFSDIKNKLEKKDDLEIYFCTILQAENRNEILKSITKKLQLEEILILFQIITKGKEKY